MYFLTFPAVALAFRNEYRSSVMHLRSSLNDDFAGLSRMAIEIAALESSKTRQGNHPHQEQEPGQKNYTSENHKYKGASPSKSSRACVARRVGRSEEKKSVFHKNVLQKLSCIFWFVLNVLSGKIGNIEHSLKDRTILDSVVFSSLKFHEICQLLEDPARVGISLGQSRPNQQPAKILKPKGLAHDFYLRDMATLISMIARLHFLTNLRSPKFRKQVQKSAQLLQRCR